MFCDLCKSIEYFMTVNYVKMIKSYKYQVLQSIQHQLISFKIKPICSQFMSIINTTSISFPKKYSISFHSLNLFFSFQFQ